MRQDFFTNFCLFFFAFRVIVLWGDIVTTGERIKEARKKAGMTQKELAEKLGIPYQGVGQWENGLRNPKIETLIKIANALGVTAAYLDGSNSYEEMIIKTSSANHDFSEIRKALHLRSDMSDEEVAAYAQNYLDWSRRKRKSARNVDILASRLKHSLSLSEDGETEFYTEWLIYLKKLLDSGKKQAPPSIFKSGYSFSPDEALLIAAFSTMSAKGQQKAVENVQDLAKIPEYQRKTLESAGEAPDTKDTTQDS